MTRLNSDPQPRLENLWNEIVAKDGPEGPLITKGELENLYKAIKEDGFTKSEIAWLTNKANRGTPARADIHVQNLENLRKLVSKVHKGFERQQNTAADQIYNTAVKATSSEGWFRTRKVTRREARKILEKMEAYISAGGTVHDAFDKITHTPKLPAKMLLRALPRKDRARMVRMVLIDNGGKPPKDLFSPEAQKIIITWASEIIDQESGQSLENQMRSRLARSAE